MSGDRYDWPTGPDLMAMLRDHCRVNGISLETGTLQAGLSRSLSWNLPNTLTPAAATVAKICALTGRTPPEPLAPGELAELRVARCRENPGSPKRLIVRPISDDSVRALSASALEARVAADQASLAAERARLRRIADEAEADVRIRRAMRDVRAMAA